MEPFVHALIPLAFLLALFPTLEKKYVFALVPIVWIIDLDSFIGIHRFTFHNIFFVLAFASLVYMAWDKRAFFVTLFYGTSHLVLDSAYPGVAWLYPLVDKTFYVTTQVIREGGHWVVNVGSGVVNIVDYPALRTTLLGPSKYIGEHSVLFIVLFFVLVLVRYRKSIMKLIFSKGP